MNTKKENKKNPEMNIYIYIFKREKRRNLESEENSKSFPLLEKTIKATSASHKTEIS